MAKKQEEYIPQFDLGDIDEEIIIPKNCSGCGKLSDYLDDNNLCYQCATILNKQRTLRNSYKVSDGFSNTLPPKNLKEEDISNIVILNPFFTNQKIFNKFICAIISPISLILSFLLISFSEPLMALFFLIFIITGSIASTSVPDGIQIIRNIKMLKKMKLFNKAQKESPVSFKAPYKITKNFIYFKGDNCAFPISYIKYVITSETFKRGLAFHKRRTLVIEMFSGKRFGLLDNIALSGTKDKDEIDWCVEEILKKNPAIELINDEF